MKYLLLLSLTSTVCFAGPIEYRPMRMETTKAPEYKTTEQQRERELVEKFRSAGFANMPAEARTKLALIAERVLNDVSLSQGVASSDISTAIKNTPKLYDAVLARVQILKKSTSSKAEGESALLDLQLVSEIGKLDAAHPDFQKNIDILKAIVEIPSEKASIVEFKKRLASGLESMTGNKTLEQVILAAGKGLGANGKQITLKDLLACLAA